MKRWGLISRLVQSWPGRETFGPYRFMPFFFLGGAVLEFAMIRWTPGGNTNFYKTYKRRQAKNIVTAELVRPVESS